MSLTRLLFKIRETRIGGATYRNLRNLFQGPGWGGFHRDAIYRHLVLDLLGAFPFTSFVETGTYHGYSTELVASTYPNLPTYSSEGVQKTYETALRYLKKFPNIRLANASSDQWIEGLLKTGELGQMPLFYLDAHWQSYWPLRTELTHISQSGLKAVIVIDDFEVPGHPEFGFDIDGGAEQTAGEKCNLDYIRPSLGRQNQYKAFFPKYTSADAFGKNRMGQLRGQIAIFQNMNAEYEAAQKLPLIQKYYSTFGDISPDNVTAPTTNQ